MSTAFAAVFMGCSSHRRGTNDAGYALSVGDDGLAITAQLDRQNNTKILVAKYTARNETSRLTN